MTPGPLPNLLLFHQTREQLKLVCNKNEHLSRRKEACFPDARMGGVDREGERRQWRSCEAHAVKICDDMAAERWR